MSRHDQLLLAMADASIRSDPTIFRRAAELGIFPTVYDWIASSGGDVSIAEPGWRRHRIAHAVRQRSLADVVETLERQSIPFAVLKGLPLGRELYGDPVRRGSSDIDLLVDSDDRDRARLALETLGYRATTAVDHDANRELELVHEANGLLIDLHWRIAFPWVPAPDTQTLLARRETAPVAGVLVPVLGRDDRFVQLVLHFHDHVGFAKGLLDLAAFLDRHPNVVERTWPTIETLGLRGVTDWPLRTLQLLGIDAPQTPIERPVVEAFAEWSAESIAGVLRRSDPITGRHPASFKLGAITPGEQVLLKAVTMALLDRRRDRIRAVTFPITSSPAALARKRGAQRPTARDWARWVARPAELAIRQIAAWRDAKRPS